MRTFYPLRMVLELQGIQFTKGRDSGNFGAFHDTEGKSLYMGHRNIYFTGHLTDSERDHQGRSYLYPDPCIFYGSASNPNIHSTIPSPGNQCNFNFHRMPEHNEGALFYSVPPYNGVQPQIPSSNLDLTAAAASSGHYSPYMLPLPSGVREFPVPTNHSAHDQSSLSSNQRVVDVATDGYHRNIYCDDDVRSFKRKNAEGCPLNYLHTGSSSSVAPVVARPTESNISQMESLSFLPPEYGRNDVESGSVRSSGNTSNLVGPDHTLAHNTSYVTQGTYIVPPVELSGNPWLDTQFCATNGDIRTSSWPQAANLPYPHALMNVACVEPGNMGVPGYEVTAINRSTAGFLHSQVSQSHANPHPMQPMRGVRGYNVRYQPQVATSSHRFPPINLSNLGTNPFHEVVDTRHAFLVPVPPTGFRLYQPHRREISLGPNARHHNLHHLRVLPEDEVAILEVPGYHEVGDSIDQHRDMRLDIDHMSYEELLALGEHIGNVGTGLTEEFIQKHLKITTFTSSESTCIDLQYPACPDKQKINFCVVCQTDYEYEENIGTLDCGHGYHGECIKKWLLVKNTCPICKATALSGKVTNYK